jgi:2-keto-4-pentenoate hydratase/2-oxohepta-3-ene-1,7-dioic acid hydratase in catechol pathway
MRLATFTNAGTRRIGVVTDDGVVDLAQAAPSLPRDMIGLLAGGSDALGMARAAAARRGPRVALADVTLDAPVPRPPKFLAIGLNYADHVKESGLDAPPFPVFFNKQSTCVVGPSAPIHLPRVSALLDYEGELAFVIGRRCRHVPRDRAAQVIAGYLVCNDVSVRDWQLRTPTMTIGKSFDTHGPLGPWLVTADEIGDPHALDLWLTVNGVEKQRSNTRHMLFKVPLLISDISAAMTLEPGDIIATGTPEGVGAGRSPQEWLWPGDVVEAEVTGIGRLRHPVVAI